MEIKKLLPGDRDFHVFETLPQSLYPENSIRHRQNDKPGADFLTACYVAVQNGAAKARVALYSNPALHYNGIPAFAIGNYECVNDHGIAADLLAHVAKEINQPGQFLIGPMNGSTWENYRFSLDHDSPPFFMEPYHHLYYNDHFRAAGFKPIARYSSFIDTGFFCDYPEVIRREAELTAAGMRIREMNMNDFENELRRLYAFITTAFEDNFLYTPVSWKTFSSKYREASVIIRPEYVLLAEDGDNDLIGFIFCYDDLFNTSEKNLVIKTLARHPSERWKGLGQILGNRVIRLARERGYASQIHAFMINDGTSTFASQRFSGHNYKNYTLYGKTL